MQNQSCQKANQETADTAAKEQIGQIVGQIVSKDQNGDQNLTEIVCQSTADADACGAETAELSGELHHKQAENGTGKAVEKHRKIAEGKCRKQNTDQRDACGREETKAVQCDDYNKIRKSELDAGNHTFQRVRKKRFQPA